MRLTLIRILKNGLPTAVVLFITGYFMSEMAGVWVNASSPQTRVTTSPIQVEPLTGQEVAGLIRSRLPYTMAAWGFGIVVFIEVLGTIWRRNKPATTSTLASTSASKTNDVDTLLNQLLVKAEADRAAMALEPVSDPALHAGCLSAALADNSESAARDSDSH